ncbi:MAG: ribonuclease E, partial [Desulfuromonadales bacterium]|nr:ribonuclease E [Desulfuromonadales bacterium]NIS40283.1 ribonuclease E [Desulfuromonadales bacterium]
TYHPCPNCSGSGRVKSPEGQAVAVLRQLHTSCAKGKFEKAEVKVPLEVANYMLNDRREELVEMEKKLKLSIHIVGDESLAA